MLFVCYNIVVHNIKCIFLLEKYFCKTKKNILILQLKNGEYSSVG